MNSLVGLIVLVGSSLALWLALVSLAVARKLRRDRREARSSRRRAHYEAILREGDLAAMTAICTAVRGIEDQVDLALSIDAVEPAVPRSRMREIGLAVKDSGLHARLAPALGSRKATRRARAAFLLTRSGSPEVVEEILPLLGDPDPDVRLVACSGLSRAATPRAAEVLIWALVAGLLPPERIIERLGAPWAVQTILSTLRDGPSKVSSALAGIARSGPDAELDASLARALGIAGDRRGATALVGLLGSDSVEVRISAARALGRIGGPDCVPVLIEALDAEEWPVRAQAAKSLGALGAGNALAPLESRLSDHAWWVRANAARSLRELGEPGLQALRRTLEHDDRYASDRAREQLELHAMLEAG